MPDKQKLARLQKATAAEAAKYLDPKELRDFLEERHPLFPENAEKRSSSDYEGPI